MLIIYQILELFSLSFIIVIIMYKYIYRDKKLGMYTKIGSTWAAILLISYMIYLFMNKQFILYELYNLFFK